MSKLWDSIRGLRMDEHVLEAIDSVKDCDMSDPEVAERAMNYVLSYVDEYNDSRAISVRALMDLYAPMQEKPQAHDARTEQYQATPGYRGRTVHTGPSGRIGDDTSHLYLHSDGKYYTKPE